MADTGLFALYKLHLVDSALYDMRQHAAALDTGKEEAAKIKAIESDPESPLQNARLLTSELKDLELEQKSLQDKLKKIDGDIFGGKIINSKEIANLEREKANIKEIRDNLDARIMELWELVPPAKERAAEIEGQIKKIQEVMAKKQAEAKTEHERLQVTFKSKSAERPALVKNVPPVLLQQYERIREKAGVGMALVTHESRCSICGMQVSARIIAHVSEDKVMQCEGCRRILFRLQQG